MPSDPTLVRRARAGDRDAFAVLVRRHHPRVLAACRRVLGDPHLAADAAQEAAVAAMLSLDRLRDDERFGAWLIGIGLNASRHLLRDRRRDPVAPAAAPPDPAELVGAADAAARVRRAIAALPPGQREAVSLHYLAGLTTAEAAEHLGVPPASVKARLHRARASLRPRLAPLWKEQYAMPAPVPMQIADVRRAGERHVLVLEEPGGGRRLQIWVGAAEALAVAALLEAVDLPRPGPHQLAAALLGAAGSGVREVRISRLADAVFYADVVLADGTAVDARPSDALTLALVAGAPVRVDPDVLDRTERDADAFAPEIAAADASTDDRRVLAAETRGRLERQARETAELAARVSRR
jgi:RNA polymerase sigma factor (sigma-70 family)